jgi:hypothetical protein
LMSLGIVALKRVVVPLWAVSRKMGTQHCKSSPETTMKVKRRSSLRAE